MLEDIADVIAANWVGIVFGLASVLTAVLIYLRSRRRAVLAYQQTGLRLLGHSVTELPPEVSVHYRGRQIPRLTRTMVVLWNDGERMISGADIVASDPVRIETGPGSEILSFTVERITRKVLELELAQDPAAANRALVTFDFLDSRDGGMFELLHTGEDRLVTLEGTVKGMPGGLKDYGTILGARFSPRVWLSRRWRDWVVLAVGVGFLVLSLGVHLTGRSGWEPIAAFAAGGILYVGTAVASFWVRRRRYPSRLHSESLE